MGASHHYPAPVAAQVTAFTRFWPAKGCHQGYYRRPATQVSIDRVSRLKVEKFRQTFAQLLKPADVL